MNLARQSSHIAMLPASEITQFVKLASAVMGFGLLVDRVLARVFSKKKLAS